MRGMHHSDYFGIEGIHEDGIHKMKFTTPNIKVDGDMLKGIDIQSKVLNSLRKKSYELYYAEVMRQVLISEMEYCKELMEENIMLRSQIEQMFG